MGRIKRALKPFVALFNSSGNEIAIFGSTISGARQQHYCLRMGPSSGPYALRATGIKEMPSIPSTLMFRPGHRRVTPQQHGRSVSLSIVDRVLFGTFGEEAVLRIIHAFSP